MRIKFKSPDPRAGTVAQMDSVRGQQLIDSGAAVQVKDGEADDAAPSPAPNPDPVTTKTAGATAKTAAKTTGKAKK
jgi:hypothetical protein